MNRLRVQQGPFHAPLSSREPTVHTASEGLLALFEGSMTGPCTGYRFVEGVVEWFHSGLYGVRLLF